MWLATKLGFFSVVCGQDNAGKIDRGVLVIRARQKKHLENILDIVGWRPILSSTDRDYPFRIAVMRQDGLRLIAELAFRIDYDNFKNAAASEDPDDFAYHRFLNATWNEGRRMQAPQWRNEPADMLAKVETLQELDTERNSRGACLACGSKEHGASWHDQLECECDACGDPMPIGVVGICQTCQTNQPKAKP